MYYLPFKPIKGQAFTLYFSVVVSSNQVYITTAQATSARSYISKDGATLGVTTNAPTRIADVGTNLSFGFFSIVLTASEMNADVVTFSVTFGTTSANTVGNIQIHIYTTPAELSSVPTLNSSISDKVTAIFQYLFFRRTSTAILATLYKNDSSTTLGTGSIADNGTTFDRGLIS